jgi:hypothetical protein
VRRTAFAFRLPLCTIGFDPYSRFIRIDLWPIPLPFSPEPKRSGVSNLPLSESNCSQLLAFRVFRGSASAPRLVRHMLTCYITPGAASLLGWCSAINDSSSETLLKRTTN